MKILPSPSIRIGPGVIRELPKVLSEIGARRVLVITDAGILKAGIWDRVRPILDAAGIETDLFPDVRPDPAISLVRTIVAKARDRRCDAVIGLGGGSSIDTAKVVAALIANQKDVRDCLGIDLLDSPALPILAIPTTAGTGSEVTPIAILSDEEANLKKAIVSPRIIPSHAILDSELTAGMPPAITAATGMDALCHAIEAYTSVNAFAYSDTLAWKAMELIGANLLRAFQNGADQNAREAMLTGSLLAGMSFANAGVTAVHAFAYPLGGMFHVPHGLANSLMLPTILKFNAAGAPLRFASVARALTGDPTAAPETAIRKIETLSAQLKLPANLRAAGIPEDAIPAMAEGAMQATRLLVNNPRPITLDDARAIYREAYSR